MSEAPSVRSASPFDEDQLEAVYDLLARPEWHERAACRGMGHAAFFVGRGESSADAKAVCGQCAVIEECGEAGRGDKFGIWGGMSERQRRRVRRTTPVVITHGTVKGYVAHYNNAEKACAECLVAYRDYQRERKGIAKERGAA